MGRRINFDAVRGLFAELGPFSGLGVHHMMSAHLVRSQQEIAPKEAAGWAA